MRKKQWYESLFENYGEKYDKEGFTQGTMGECDFIESELGFNTGLKILDAGCGTGRHAVEPNHFEMLVIAEKNGEKQK